MHKNIKLLLLTSILIHSGANLLAPIYAIFIKEIGGNLIDAGIAVGIYALLKGVMKVGTSVEGMLKNDLKLEIDAIADLRKAIATAITEKDTGTKDILEKILISEETHLDFLETQLELMVKVGLQNYLASQM